MAERRCPQCGSVAGWEGNPHRPFCSERCRLVDLEGWLGGRYAIPGESVPESPGEADPEAGDAVARAGQARTVVRTKGRAPR